MDKQNAAPEVDSRVAVVEYYANITKKRIRIIENVFK